MPPASVRTYYYWQYCHVATVPEASWRVLKISTHWTVVDQSKWKRECSQAIGQCWRIISCLIIASIELPKKNSFTSNEMKQNAAKLKSFSLLFVSVLLVIVRWLLSLHSERNGFTAHTHTHTWMEIIQMYSCEFERPSEAEINHSHTLFLAQVNVNKYLVVDRHFQLTMCTAKMDVPAFLFSAAIWF